MGKTFSCGRIVGITVFQFRACATLGSRKMPGGSVNCFSSSGVVPFFGVPELPPSDEPVPICAIRPPSFKPSQTPQFSAALPSVSSMSRGTARDKRYSFQSTDSEAAWSSLLDRSGAAGASSSCKSSGMYEDGEWSCEIWWVQYCTFNDVRVSSSIMYAP